VGLFKTIDEDPPDKDLLEALMAMFYGANKVNATDAEHMLSYRLFQIAKRLNSGELLLLRILYGSFKRGMTWSSSRPIRLGKEDFKIARPQPLRLSDEG
jgi:hypothetical protein